MVTNLPSDSQKVEIKAWFSVAQVPDGFGMLHQALVKISERLMTVAMLREVPSTSGVLLETIEHEHKHKHKHAKMAELEIAHIVDKEVAKLQRAFRASMASTKTSRTPWTARPNPGLHEAACDAFAGTAQPASQSRLDTPAEYARVQLLGKDRPEIQKSCRKIGG